MYDKRQMSFRYKTDIHAKLFDMDIVQHIKIKCSEIISNTRKLDNLKLSDKAGRACTDFCKHRNCENEYNIPNNLPDKA